MHLARRSTIDCFCSSYVARLVDYAEMASANLLRFVELGVHEPETVLCFETVKAEPSATKKGDSIPGEMSHCSVQHQSVRLATERGYVYCNIGNHFAFISYCFPLFVFIVLKTSFLVQRSFHLIPQIPRFPLQQQIALGLNFYPGKALVRTAFLIEGPQGTVRWSFRRFAEGPRTISQSN
jgi:hypothetical protein